MIRQLLDEMICRPCDALYWSVEIVTQNVSNIMRINAAISRSVYYLSRPVSGNRCIAAFTPTPSSKKISESA